MAHRTLSVLLLPLLLSVVASISYSASQAQTELYLSYSAYCSNSSIVSWDCWFCEPSSFHVVATFYNSSTNIYGYVGYTGSTGHVVFRGTESDSLTNWITDLNTLSTTVYSLVPGGIVHAGFYAAWNSVKAQVQTAVHSLSQVHGITSVYYTGHSLGAALTLFAALEVGTTYSTTFFVYNFGEPRVGNKIFAQWANTRLQNNIVRVTNQEDPVPHLPTESMGFWHVATEVYYTSSSSFEVCNTSGEDPSCSDANSLDLDVDDHLDYLGVSLLVGELFGC